MPDDDPSSTVLEKALDRNTASVTAGPFSAVVALFRLRSCVTCRILRSTERARGRGCARRARRAGRGASFPPALSRHVFTWRWNARSLLCAQTGMNTRQLPKHEQKQSTHPRIFEKHRGHWRSDMLTARGDHGSICRRWGAAGHQQQLCC